MRKYTADEVMSMTGEDLVRLSGREEPLDFQAGRTLKKIETLKEIRRGRAILQAEEERGIARQNAEIAIQNELLTRSRVDANESLLSRGFWGRLRWLLTGK